MIPAGKLSRQQWRRLGLGALALATAFLCVAVALARPGGGGSFSSGGGSSHSSGGGGGSGGGGIADALIGFIVELIFEAIFQLILWLVTTYPAIGVPLLLGIVVLVFAFSAKHRWAIVGSVLGLIGVTVVFQKSVMAGYGATGGLVAVGLLYAWLAPDQGWSTRTTTSAVPSPVAPPAPVTADLPAAPPASPVSPWVTLEKIRDFDPEFSPILFEDFAYLLFAEVHRARGDRALDRVAPYVDAATRTRLASRPVSAVRDVIIGAMRLLSVIGVGKRRSNHGDVTLLLEFEANYTEVNEQGREQGLYTVERWQLARSRDAQSRPPAQASVLPCPACGAPLELAVGGACTYCHKVVEDERFSWRVTQVTLVRREVRGPVLTSDIEEQGTNLATVVAPDADERLVRLTERDPAFSMKGLHGRLDLIFAAMQVGWSSRDLSGVRPFVSDSLFQSLGYWVEAYRKAKLRNVSEKAAISQIELAKVSSDKFFDAVTLRVRASGLDYVLGDDDTLVSGSRETPRVYTEYWTLIRSATRQGAASDAPVCPNCGAPLAISMAGHCTHCQAKVTAGEFDWVLSRIEQDEVYTG
jgi:hypothetical protein